MAPAQERVRSGRSTAAREVVREALSILEERFARVDIDREEFEERRRTLRGGSP